jgi:hypothetical protein
VEFARVVKTLSAHIVGAIDVLMGVCMDTLEIRVNINALITVYHVTSTMHITVMTVKMGIITHGYQAVSGLETARLDVLTIAFLANHILTAHLVEMGFTMELVTLNGTTTVVCPAIRVVKHARRTVHAQSAKTGFMAII